MPTCINDAIDMHGALAEHGYSVRMQLDGTRKQLRAAFNEFLATLEDGALVLLYFAGHGVSRNDRNYIVPIDGEVGRTTGAACAS